MPINYKDYPANWKSEIRPAILERANHKCEFCGVENYKYIFRGYLNSGTEVYQDAEGNIYIAANSCLILMYDFETEIRAKGKDRAIKVVLTIAHLDHDIQNNDYSNLKALCQQCHLRHDKHHHQRKRSKNQIKLF